MDGAGLRRMVACCCSAAGWAASASGAGARRFTRRLRAVRAASGPAVRMSSGSVVSTVSAGLLSSSSSDSKRIVPVGSDTAGGAVWVRPTFRWRVAPGSADSAGAGSGVGGATGSAVSKSSIGSKSAVRSGSVVGGVRRRSENRTVLPRSRPASDTISSGRSRPGRKMMQESVNRRPSTRRRSRSKIWLPMVASFRSGGSAQAAAPWLSQISTKGHWPTVAGMYTAAKSAPAACMAARARPAAACTTSPGNFFNSWGGTVICFCFSGSA